MTLHNPVNGSIRPEAPQEGDDIIKAAKVEIHLSFRVLDAAVDEAIETAERMLAERNRLLQMDAITGLGEKCRKLFALWKQLRQAV